MLKHVNSVHGGNKDGIEFEMKITDVFKDDPLGRQCMEGIKIRETICDHSLNSKEEFRQPGELVAELPSRRQQHGQHGRQQQRQLRQQDEQQQQQDQEGEGGEVASTGGGPCK